jgi:hypothetical protein
MSSVVPNMPAKEVAERPSRPPGFDMTYEPEECVFGPTWLSRLPSLLYLLAALATLLLLFIGENSSSTSRLFHYVVVEDKSRVMSMRTFSVVLLVGAVASVLRAGMRGVRIYADGVEAREITSLVMPRVRKYTWPQLECIVLNTEDSIAVDLWDGRREFLPKVNNRPKLEATLERVGAARAIPVRGGKGLDEWVEPVADSR